MQKAAQQAPETGTERGAGARTLRLPQRMVARVAGGRELWALTDQALVSGANFLSYALLARTLGLAEFGVFTLAWMAVLFANSLQMALIVSPMMSVGPKQPEAQRAGYYGAMAMQAVALSVLASLLVWGVGSLLAQLRPGWHAGRLALPLAAATGCYLLQDWTRRYFFTRRQSRRALASDAVSYITQLPLLWLWAEQQRLSSVSALWIMAATSLLAVVVSVGLRGEMAWQPRLVWPVMQRHWPIARWLAPSAALQWLSQNLFVVSAPLYYGAAAAGALRACQNLVGVAHIWFLGLDNVMPAEAARQLHERGVGAMTRYVRSMLVRWGAVTAGFMLVIGLFPSFWLSLVYGPKFGSFGYLLRLYGLLYVMIFLGGPLRAGLQALEFTAPMLWSYTAMTAFAALFAAPLARQLGLPGVMLGLMATQLIFQAVLAVALLVRARRLEREQMHAAAEAPASTRPAFLSNPGRLAEERPYE